MVKQTKRAGISAASILATFLVFLPFPHFSELAFAEDPTLHQGWPRSVDDPGCPVQITQHLTVADVNRDGKADILIGYGRTVRIFDHAGAMLPGWPQPVSSDPTVYTNVSPAVGELDGNLSNGPEVVAVNNICQVFLWHGDGTAVAGWPISIPSPMALLGMNAPAISDLDGDGANEIVLVDRAGMIRVLDRAGQLHPGWLQGGHCVDSSPPAIGDIDRDGRKELAISDMGPQRRGGVFHLFHSDGTSLSGYPATILSISDLPSGQRSFNYPALGDLDGDSRLDLVCGTLDGRVYVFGGGGLWPKMVANPAMPVSPVSLGDMDGDGALEVIVGTQRTSPFDISRLFGWHGNGGALTLAAGIIGGGYNSSLVDLGFCAPVVADVNGDGQADLLTVGPLRDVPSGYGLYAFGIDMATYQSRLLPGYPIPLPAPPADPSMSPAVADLDGDGLLEIAWVDAQRNLYVWDIPSPATSRLPWPMFRRNGRHTASIPAGNRPPVLSPIGNKTVDEGRLLAFTVSATDPDRDMLTYSANPLPSGATLNATTGAFSWTPTYTQAGSYSVTFTAADEEGATASQTITITVNNINRAPVLSPIGSKTVNEGVQFGFTVTATDPDGDPLTYSTSALPRGATFTSATHSFLWTPDFTQAGSYSVTFTVSDGVLAASETVPITVNNVNRAPVLAPIGNKTFSRSQTLNFSITASDPDGDPLQFGGVYIAYGGTPVWTSGPGSTAGIAGLPGEAAITHSTYFGVAFGWNGFGVGFQPGTYLVRIMVRDPEGAEDSETVTITVRDLNDNRPPILSPIENKTVRLGELLDFTLQASDPDGDSLSYHINTAFTNGPSLNYYTGRFTWQLRYLSQVGQYTFRVGVSDGQYSSNEQTFTVTVPNNLPPVFSPIGSKSVKEGSALTFTVDATDPEGDPLTFSARGLPAGATFDPLTRTFRWTPANSQVGFYFVVFGVSDVLWYEGYPRLTNYTVSIDVRPNRPPVLDPIGNKTGYENQLLSFTLSATDPDIGDTLTYLTAAPLPSGAGLNSTTGAFTWTPSYTQSGSYPVTFRVSDGLATASETITITVVNVNRRPVLDPIGPKTVNEGQLLTFTLSANDPDGDPLNYFTYGNLLPGATLDAATGVYSWTPPFTSVGAGASSGTFLQVFDVSDGSLTSASGSQGVIITVINVNRPPVLDPIPNQTVDENRLLSFTVNATDPDGDPLIYSTAAPLPSGAALNSTTGAFTWTPTFSQSGIYTVTARVTDSGSPSLTDSKTFTITVINVNRPPVLDPIPNQTVDENQLLSFTLSATDPDSGDTLTYSTAAPLPSGAALNSAIGAFTWTPTFSQSGIYTVTARVTDSGSPALSDSKTFTITVNNVNRAPVLAPIGNKTVIVGLGKPPLTFTVTGSDPDGDPLTFSASNLPAGATFNPLTQTFFWAPGSGDVGVYPGVHFEVRDDGNLTASENITITVQLPIGGP